MIRSIDDEDAEVFGVAVCVGELLERLKSLDKKSNDKQLSVVMSLALSTGGSLYLICLLLGRMDRIASSVSNSSESLSRRFTPLILFEQGSS